LKACEDRVQKCLLASRNQGRLLTLLSESLVFL